MVVIRTIEPLDYYYLCDDANDLMMTAFHFQLSMERTYAALPTNVWELSKNSLPITVIPDYDPSTGTVYFPGTRMQCRYYNGAKWGDLEYRRDATEFYFYTVSGGN